jgi:hypothetical protein
MPMLNSNLGWREPPHTTNVAMRQASDSRAQGARKAIHDRPPDAE